MFTKITQWFLYSSADPTKFSLTLKGFIPFIMLLGAGKYITVGDASNLIDLFVNALVAVTTAISGLIALYGAARKVYLTATSK